MSKRRVTQDDICRFLKLKGATEVTNKRKTFDQLRTFKIPYNKTTRRNDHYFVTDSAEVYHGCTLRQATNVTHFIDKTAVLKFLDEQG